MKDIYFQQDLKNGQHAEKRFAQIMRLTHGLKFTRVVGKFHDWDLKDPDGYTYEIKRDYWTVENGNIAIEEWSNYPERKKGWIYKTKADAYVCMIEDDMFVLIDMRDLKSYWESMKEYVGLKRAYMNQDVRFGLVNLKSIKNHFPIKVIKFDEKARKLKDITDLFIESIGNTQRGSSQEV